MKTRSRSIARPKTRRHPEASFQIPIRLKRILVTTDFSDESRKALPVAAGLAERFGSEVTLLNVLEPPSRFAGLESVVLLQAGDSAVGRVYGGLDALAEMAFTPKIHAHTQVRTGKPFREIMKAVSELETDLLIMATHGYTGLKHTFLGSTTERVVRHAPCAVLAVRTGHRAATTKQEKPFTIQRMVLATDFSENSLQAFPFAQSLAAGFGATIHLLHVVERFPIDAVLGEEMNRETSTRLIEQARGSLTEVAESLRKKNRGIEVDPVVRFGTPFAEIVSAAESLDASLIVLATHGYTGLKHMYLGSVAERVVRHAHCPVLVTRQTPR